MKVTVIDLDTEATLADWVVFRVALPVVGDVVVIEGGGGTPAKERAFKVEVRIWRENLSYVSLMVRKL